MNDKLIKTKRCVKCKKIKSIIEFYKSRGKKDGHRYDCKLCHLKNMKRYFQTKKGKYVISKAVRCYQQTEKGRIAKRIWEKRYYISHPQYHKSSASISYAIKTGKLPHPDSLQCHYCFKQAEQYHHPDYNRPLYVIPVCRKCHRKLRKKIA